MTASSVCDHVSRLPSPVLILSSHAGRGMHSIGEAVRQGISRSAIVHHLPIEQLLPSSAVSADLNRYRWMTRHAPWLLNLMYRVPYFYRRKQRRERSGAATSLDQLRETIDSLGIQTVVAISHRAAFWIGILKERDRRHFQLWGLEAEYGPSLAWQYVFWEQMDGFLSPQPREHLPYPILPATETHRVAVPVSAAFLALADHPGDRQRVLLTGGYWGLGALLPIARQLTAACPNLCIDVLCGENMPLLTRMRAAFAGSPNVSVFGAVESLVPLMARAGAVIGKPGISTIVETCAAGRHLFLLRGLPVAEDHNAQYAIAHLGATWFSLSNFRRWQAGR